MSFSRLVAVLALAGLASSAHAQTSIGKPGNFPITINQPGSYKLTQNLVVPNGANGIVVTAANVTLDLNGYAITGSNSCTGGYMAMSCVGSPSSYGVDAYAGNMVSVRNGQISGFGVGVRSGFGSTIEDLRISSIWTAGVVATTGSTARNLNIFYIKGVGISASNSLLQNVNVGYAALGADAVDSLISGSTFNNVTSGIQDGSYGQFGMSPAMRETYIHATGQAVLGTVRSLGNNSCNGALC